MLSENCSRQLDSYLITDHSSPKLADSLDRINDLFAALEADDSSSSGKWLLGRRIDRFAEERSIAVG